MSDDRFRDIYHDVPEEQVKALLKFRAEHQYKKATIAGRDWRYISCGAGKEPLLILPGGTKNPDSMFRIIQLLEPEFRIVSPSYPAVNSMAGIVEGVRRIMEDEGIPRTNVYGASFGGYVAQCFVYLHPELSAKAILSNTMAPGDYQRTASVQTIMMQLLSLLPERLLNYLIYIKNRPLLDVPEAERAFWEALMKEAFTCRFKKADALALNEAVVDFIKNYRFRAESNSQFDGKMLIIESGHDKAFNLKAREKLKATYPGAQVYTFSDAGHTPMMRDPVRYASIIRDFYRG